MRSRFDRTKISPERDALFATGVLTLLRHRGDELPGDAHALLSTLGESPAYLHLLDAQQAIKAMFSLHPALVQEVSSANMAMHSMLPIWIWASEEAGRPDCGLDRRLSAWGEGLKNEATLHLENCLRALNMTHALLPELMPPDVAALATFWQDEKSDVLWSNIYTLTDEKFRHWLAAITQVGLLHEHAAVLGLKDGVPQGKPAWSQRWAQGVGAALSDMSDSQQEQCLLHLAASPLAPTYKLRACKHARPEVWLLPQVAAALDPVLPKSDVMRWPMLPWSQAPRDNSNARRRFSSRFEPASMIACNQGMMRMYCPEAATVLDVVATPEMWLNRSFVAKSMALFRKNATPPEIAPDAGDIFAEMQRPAGMQDVGPAQR